MKEENLTTLTWIRGRIENLIIGNDGKCRMVDVRTSTGITKRSITNVCPFPTEDCSDEVISNEENVKSTKIKAKVKNKNIIMIILTFLLILPSNNCQLTINKFKDTSGIVIERQGNMGFTRTTWDILGHINMTDYHRQKEMLQKAPVMLDILKAKITNVGLAEEETTKTLALQIKNRLLEINEIDEVIRSGGKQRKMTARSLAACITHYLDSWTKNTPSF